MHQTPLSSFPRGMHTPGHKSQTRYRTTEKLNSGSLFCRLAFTAPRTGLNEIPKTIRTLYKAELSCSIYCVMRPRCIQPPDIHVPFLDLRATVAYAIPIAPALL